MASVCHRCKGQGVRHVATIVLGNQMGLPIATPCSHCGGSGRAPAFRRRVLMPARERVAPTAEHTYTDSGYDRAIRAQHRRNQFHVVEGSPIARSDDRPAPSPAVAERRAQIHVIN